MRMLKIPDLEYEEFVAIRDVILDNVPFAMINEIYHGKRKTGYFYFWDSDYIPMKLRKFILQPPADREPMEKQLNELTELMEKLNK